MAQCGDQQAHTYGAWSKVLRLDRHNGSLRLYRGSLCRLKAYPADFAENLEAAIGFWPGTPDSYRLSPWWLDADQGIDLDTFMEQVERLDRYLDRMAEFAIAHEEFELLLGYHPTVDEFLHANLIVDPRQWAHSPGRALAAAEALKRMGASVDLSMGAMWRALDPSRDALAVVSDHGLLPLHDVVYINQALADAGLVEFDEEGRVAASTPMNAFTSGGCAHIYLNLKGRELEGTVYHDQAPDLLQRAARTLADIAVDGEPVIEKILNRAEALEFGLGHANSGDLVVFLRPGFAASSRPNVAISEPTSYYAQHGYLNHHDALCGIFFARGAGVARKHRKELASIDVVPMLSVLLERPTE